MTLGIRLLLLVLVAAMPILGLQVAEQLEDRAMRRAEVGQQLVTLARLAAAREDRWGEMARSVLAAAAQLPEIRTPQCRAPLRALRERFPRIAEIGVASAAGAIICPSNPEARSIDLLQRADFAQAVRQKTFSAAGLSSGTGGLAFSYPIAAESGAVAAVAFLSVGRDQLSSSLADTPVPSDAMIGLFDSAGMVLARAPEAGAAAGSNQAGAGYLRAIGTRGQSIVESDELDGIRRLIGVAPLAAPVDLYVAVGVPRAGLFAEADRQFRWKMVLVAVVFALAAVAALVGGEIGMRRPILALKRAVTRMEWGDLAARPKLGGGGIRELGELAQSFNAMAASLQAQERELRAAKDDAERARQEAERARQEAEQARQEAERATEAKTRFFAAASHDLRQPFQAMRLFLHLLDRRLPDEESREIARHLGDSTKAGEDLLSALLDVATLESGTVRAQPVVFPVRPLIERIVGEFRPQAEAKGLRLRCQPSSLSVISDPLLLDRILRNLVSNAVRYTARGKILVGCRRSGGRLRLEVWDTGRGIPPDKLRAIFEEFYRIDDGPTQGLGLGLSIVERMTRLLGHRLDVRSWPGGGSMFSVELPVAAAGPEAADAPKPDIALSGSRILVIEDDAAQRIAIKHLLARWGCEVVAAPSVDAALLALEDGDRPPDLILTDFGLPGHRTGFEAIAQVCAAAKTMLPAAILTGGTSSENMREAERRGYRVLRKPLDSDELGSVLADMLTGRGQARPADA